MFYPHFEIGQEVHICCRCGLCGKLETELTHPVVITAITPYDQGFACRIEDARGLHYETAELCLCKNALGHSSSPCVFCGQLVPAHRM